MCGKNSSNAFHKSRPKKRLKVTLHHLRELQSYLRRRDRRREKKGKKFKRMIFHSRAFACCRALFFFFLISGFISVRPSSFLSFSTHNNKTRRERKTHRETWPELKREIFSLLRLKRHTRAHLTRTTSRQSSFFCEYTTPLSRVLFQRVRERELKRHRNTTLKE